MFWLTFLGVGLVAGEPLPAGHLKALGMHSGPEGSIDQVEGFLEPKEFYDNYVSLSQPVLFKGAAKNIPAYKLWTDEYLE